jgi:hypothetical protein
VVDAGVESHLSELPCRFRLPLPFFFFSLPHSWALPPAWHKKNRPPESSGRGGLCQTPCFPVSRGDAHKPLRKCVILKT